MMSSRLAPASRFSKIADTGIRVPFNTHAPLTLPGTLSTAGHCDQSRFAMDRNSWLEHSFIRIQESRPIWGRGRLSFTGRLPVDTIQLEKHRGCQSIGSQCRGIL